LKGIIILLATISDIAWFHGIGSLHEGFPVATTKLQTTSISGLAIVITSGIDRHGLFHFKLLDRATLLAS
jgi:hypothetical protein